MTARDILLLIVKKVKIVVIFPIIVVTIVAYINYTTEPPVYYASATLYTIDKATTNLSEIAAVERLMPNYLVLSRTPEMVSIVNKALGLAEGDTYGNYCSVSITQNIEAHTMTISTHNAKNPAWAANIVNTYCTCIIQYLQNTMGREDISIIESAYKPAVPTGPVRQEAIIMAGIIGLAIGIGFVFILEFTNTTVRRPDEIEEDYGLPILAEVTKFNVSKRKK